MENNLEEIANKIRINTVKEVYYAHLGIQEVLYL